MTNNRLLRELATLARGGAAMLTRQATAGLEAYQASESRLAAPLLLPNAARVEELGGHPALATARSMGKTRRIYEQSSQLTRSIVLKAPGAGGEKGVLLIYFEYNLLRLAWGLPDLRAFEKEYDLVFAASWSPTNYGVLAAVLARTKGTLFVHPANRGEVEKIQAFHPRLRCLPGLACDWVNPALFFPKPHEERRYDLLMVANWAPFKRHFEFFDALSGMSAQLRVALVGQKELGIDAGAIRRMAAALGVRQQLDFFESIPIAQVRALQCDSKAAIILSRREGGCVGAVEALFANTPLGMRADAHVGALAHVNPETGLRLNPHRSMAGELQALLDAAPSLNPRKWAEANISCTATLDRIGEVLKAHAVAEGRPWTTGLMPMCWNPYPQYLHPRDLERMRPVYQDLHLRFPKVFADNLIDNTFR